MNSYSILVQARNRALAADSGPEQRALYRFIQDALDNYDSTPPDNLRVPVAIAQWYISQEPNGEG